jgi:hypothetical protein
VGVGVVGGQSGQGRPVEDADRRLRVVGEGVALDRGQGRVEQDRDDADPGRPEYGAEQVGRRAEREGDPVARATALGEECARRPSLTDLGVGRVEDFDFDLGLVRRPGPRHRGSVCRFPVPPWRSWRRYRRPRSLGPGR